MSKKTFQIHDASLSNKNGYPQIVFAVDDSDNPKTIWISAYQAGFLMGVNPEHLVHNLDVFGPFGENRINFRVEFHSEGDVKTNTRRDGTKTEFVVTKSDTIVKDFSFKILPSESESYFFHKRMVRQLIATGGHWVKSNQREPEISADLLREDRI